MVLDFYKLREQPFGMTPDPRFLYLSATHQEALASLLYGVSTGRGFIALIAKPGMGKTTLLFRGLEQLGETAKTVFLFQTISTPLDFLRALLTDLGLDAAGGDLIELQAKLNEVLLEQSRSGKRLILVIDEAQNLDGSVFELVRMLSNFETSRDKLMQIILSGQPQLADKLASPSLEQLRQRVSIIAQLKPFSVEDTKLYVQHRLRVAGYKVETPLFTDSALVLIATLSEGIPRNINNLCFNALSLGCALRRRTIDTEIVVEVLGDLDLSSLQTSSPVAPSTGTVPPPLSALSGLELRTRTSRVPKFAMSLVAAVALVALGWALARVHSGEERPIEIRASAAPAPTTAKVQSSPDPQPDTGTSSTAAPTDTPQPQAASSMPQSTAAPSAKVQSSPDPQPDTGTSSTLAQTDAPQPQAAPSTPQSAAPSKASTPSPQPDQPQQALNGLRAKAQPSEGPATPISPSPEPDLPAGVGAFRVKHGATLTRLCIERFGTCSQENLRQLRRLNPGIRNPNHVKSGQVIYLPLRTRLTEVGQSGVE
jgi:general secretion pathway protein A